MVAVVGDFYAGKNERFQISVTFAELAYNSALRQVELEVNSQRCTSSQVKGKQICSRKGTN